MNRTLPTGRIQTAQDIAQKAGDVALIHFENRSALVVEAKKPRDFVSEADADVEQFIKRQLQSAYPEDQFLGEEGGGDVGDTYWVVDPVDGTSNFLKGSPLWGISIAYMVCGRPTVGVMHYPKLGFTLSALDGAGAFLDGKAFTRPEVKDVKIAGVGENAYWESDRIGAIEKHLRDSDWGVAGYRCASIALGFAILGYTDGYVEKRLSLWDLAAGVLIGEEVGLKAVYTGSTAATECEILLGTPALHSVLGEFFGPPS